MEICLYLAYNSEQRLTQHSANPKGFLLACKVETSTDANLSFIQSILEFNKQFFYLTLF